MPDFESQPYIEKLTSAHLVTDFDCGQAELNQFLHKYAYQNQKANSSQTYIGIYEGGVIGYYSLTVGSVIHSQAPSRVTKGQPKHPISVMILARLAVDREFQNRGVGEGLLKDALKRTAPAADLAGIRALLFNAKNSDVKLWYEKFNFEPSRIDSLSLFLLLKDSKKVLEIE
ncbi:GNAT family N-acetyltransferase [Chamaesiphon sp. GL140_3_metabinner_50]|uniref:GNAT family N-acetyltransferase n=1 Tax=Chamaesiphon sp. GL140_3_metabinner_50 TaxID=2970812 RepID=UPI0025F37B4E|nr:GNAT family N-acetyltransferase [Chamaesiphon sp. GL140_3_metabinner_50]